MPAVQYWLLKTDAESFSFDDLWRAPKRTTGWSGVRNYQVRNFMTQSMRVGDGAIVYHSSSDPTGVAGLAEVASPAYPDPTQFDPSDEHFDPKSPRDAPRWFQVDVRATARLARFVTLAELRASKKLAGMAFLRPGSRLSITPVTPAEWREVLRLGGAG